MIGLHLVTMEMNSLQKGNYNIHVHVHDHMYMYRVHVTCDRNKYPCKYNYARAHHRKYITEN